jgi:hypothetical protein
MASVGAWNEGRFPPVGQKDGGISTSRPGHVGVGMFTCSFS